MIVAVRLLSAIGPHPDPSTSPTAGVPEQRSLTVRTACSTRSFMEAPQASEAHQASGREDNFPDDLTPDSEGTLELPVEHHADPAGVAERQRQPLLSFPPNAVAGIQQHVLGRDM